MNVMEMLWLLKEELTWVFVLVSVFLSNHTLLGKSTVLTHWLFAHRFNELYKPVVKPCHESWHCKLLELFLALHETYMAWIIHAHLKLLLKSTLSCFILLLHVTNDKSELMRNHTGVSTSDVVTQSIMDESILVLLRNFKGRPLS